MVYKLQTCLHESECAVMVNKTLLRILCANTDKQSILLETNNKIFSMVWVYLFLKFYLGIIACYTYLHTLKLSDTYFLKTLKFNTSHNYIYKEVSSYYEPQKKGTGLT